MATTLQILRKARKLIEKRERWIKFHLAETKDGGVVPATSKAAVLFCALGALQRAANTDSWDFPATDAFGKAIGTDKIGFWNNRPRRTHAQVLRAFDKAIAKLARATSQEPKP